MGFPFFWKEKKKNLVHLNSEQNNSFRTKIVVDEKEKVLQEINQEQLENFFSLYNFSKDNISIYFANVLKMYPTLLSYFTNHIIDSSIINKINDNELRVTDIKWYDKDLFLYDIFSNEDQSILEIFRNDVTLSDKVYANFELDAYVNYIKSPNFIECSIPSLLENESLLIEKKKAIPLNHSWIHFDKTSEILFPLNQEQIFSNKIFDSYYSGDIEFNKETILFISFEQLQGWITQEEKLNILKKVQVVIKDDLHKINHLIDKIDFFHCCFSLNNNEVKNKLLIQVNHLLYVIDNSSLDLEEKNYYHYYIVETFINSSNNYNFYFNMNQLEYLASKIQQRIEQSKITEITKKFNELDISEKTKNVEQIEFSVDIFLRQFDDLDNISSFNFLDCVTSLKDEQRECIFENEIVRNKLKDLLEDSSNDPYRYYEIAMKSLSIEEVFKIFDVGFLSAYFKKNRYQAEYIFFYTILEKDINGALKYLLSDDDYFEEFTRDIDRYSFMNLDYSLLLNLLKKMEQKNIYNNLSFLMTVDKITQLNLLKEQFSNDFLVKIVRNCNREVQQFFYLEDKRFTYLYDKFNILDLSKSNYKFPDEIIYQEEFFDHFKSTSLIQFRANVNQFSIHQPNIFFEEKVYKYEDGLIASYDVKSGLFIQYQYLLDNLELLDNSNFIYKEIDFFYDSDLNYEIRKNIAYDDNNQIYIKAKEEMVKYLQDLSKRKLNEIIIDRLFKDNIYNVFLNIKEMLRFHKGLSEEEQLLDSEQIDFYKTVLNIDRLDKITIMKFYEKFKDKNVAFMFYEDLRKLKNKSYDKIKKNLFQPENMKELEQKELSKKYDVPVFDLRGKEYTILARCMNRSNNNLTYNRRDCYTLLSDENSSVMYDDSYIYGYSGFDNDCVLHVFEADSFSGDVKWSELDSGSDRVNRIMTSQEIATNSTWYSEVQIVNKKNNQNNNMFETLKPSFLIVYDDIDEKTLNEAKRNNIPICIISHSLNRELAGKITFDEQLDKYTKEYGISNESERRMHR